MPYSFTLTATIPASARQIYDTWLDSLAHSQMTGGAARMSDALGAAVSAWDGYISGRNLELIPGRRIVQSWRTTQFTDQHADSIITVTLEDTADGTLLTLVHGNVPDDHRSYEEGGWQSNYFEPMQEYFGGRRKRAAKALPAKRKTKLAAAVKPKRAKPGKSGKQKPAKRMAKEKKSVPRPRRRR